MQLLGLSTIGKSQMINVKKLLAEKTFAALENEKKHFSEASNVQIGKQFGITPPSALTNVLRRYLNLFQQGKFNDIPLSYRKMLAQAGGNSLNLLQSLPNAAMNQAYTKMSNIQAANQSQTQEVKKKSR